MDRKQELMNEITQLANELMAGWPSSRNKQKNFILAYVENGFTNASEAARKAGYSEKTATKQASKLLSGVDKSRHISETVEKLKKAYEERSVELSIATGTEVMQHFTRVLRREEPEYQVVVLKKREEKWVEVNGQLKKQTIEEEYPEIVPSPTRVSDTNKAGEMIGKSLSLWTDKLDVTNRNIEIVVGDWDEEEPTED